METYEFYTPGARLEALEPRLLDLERQEFQTRLDLETNPTNDVVKQQLATLQEHIAKFRELKAETERELANAPAKPKKVGETEAEVVETS